MIATVDTSVALTNIPMPTFIVSSKTPLIIPTWTIPPRPPTYKPPPVVFVFPTLDPSATFRSTWTYYATDCTLVAVLDYESQADDDKWYAIQPYEVNVYGPVRGTATRAQIKKGRGQLRLSFTSDFAAPQIIESRSLILRVYLSEDAPSYSYSEENYLSDYRKTWYANPKCP
jgi:hypothetical protein